MAAFRKMSTFKAQLRRCVVFPHSEHPQIKIHCPASRRRGAEANKNPTITKPPRPPRSVSPRGISPFRSCSVVARRNLPPDKRRAPRRRVPRGSGRFHPQRDGGSEERWRCPGASAYASGGLTQTRVGILRQGVSYRSGLNWDTKPEQRGRWPARSNRIQPKARNHFFGFRSMCVLMQLLRETQ